MAETATNKVQVRFAKHPKTFNCWINIFLTQHLTIIISNFNNALYFQNLLKRSKTLVHFELSYLPVCAQRVSQSRPSLSGWWSCPERSLPAVPTPRCPVGHTACSAPPGICKRGQWHKGKLQANCRHSDIMNGKMTLNCWNTWEKGSSWPTLWFWKHIRHHGLQILPECRETSRPSSEN